MQTKKPHRILFWIFAVALIGLVLGNLVQPASAQFGSSAWSSGEVIFDAPGKHVSWPRAVADQAGNVHMFWEYSDTRPQDGLQQTPFFIYYSRWDGKQWTNPIDVLVAPEGSTYQPTVAATIDPQGYLDVVWSGGGLYFSRAHAQEAENGQKWSEPQRLAEFSFQSDIQAGKDGTLYVIYPLAGEDVFAIRSQDYGVSWSAPVNISTVSENRFTSWARLAVDENNRLHAVWETQPIPGAYPPAGVFYAQSQDGGDTWTEPKELGGQDSGQPNVVVDKKGFIYVTWNGDVQMRGRYFRWSRDEGRTWSETIDLMEGQGERGLNGPSVMGFDSLGVLQMAISDKTVVSNGPVYANMRNNVWSYPTDIAPGGKNAYSESITGAVRLGNQFVLLIPINFSRILFTSMQLEAPALPAQALPTAILSNEPTPTSVKPRATATQPAELGEIKRPVENLSIENNWIILVAGVVPAGILLIIAFLIQSRKK